MSRELRVGLLVVVALTVLGIGTFMVGERENLFAFKNRYTVDFVSVGGLAVGNPVQLNGVNVGRVEAIVLPERIEQKLLTVRINVDRRFEERIREDSVARIKTLGLLGDKYIEISSGSAEKPAIPSGGKIPAAPATDVDQLLASGEDLVENVVAISISLRNILGRMEAGTGILGELTTDTEAGRRAKEAMLSILETTRRIADEIDTGDGTLAALIRDDELIRRTEGALDRLEALLARLDQGDGALPTLINDPETGERLQQAMGNLATAAENFAELSTELNEGSGLLAKLLSDEEYSGEVSEDLRQLMRNLNALSEKLERGDGTLGQLINDPQVYQAANDILVGINESKLLRWLIRNRQKKGIKKRYKDEVRATEADPAPAGSGG